MLPRLNYARFFLGDVLKNAHGKVLYLDTDTIVHGDVAELVDAALAGGAPAVAAVPRGDGRKLRLAPSVTTDPAARAALSARGVGVNTTQRRRPRPSSTTSTRASSSSIDEWDARNLTATTLEWMALNLAHGLYTGSNPPLVLAVAGDFERLDARWNCPAAPRALPLRDACVERPGIVHLTGRDKPWLGDGTLDARWAAQVPERLEACLLDAGLDSAAEAARRRAMRVRAAHRQRARFPSRTGTSTGRPGPRRAAPGASGGAAPSSDVPSAPGRLDGDARAPGRIGGGML
ncbi:polygalacturonate 4-alpha-galacturonosyltransferase [Aureococcus anophagefferens]|nr:polygalacturonate 4-alpha-galacturonosyltransferase [Aureococcus anophagefferens]